MRWSGMFRQLIGEFKLKFWCAVERRCVPAGAKPVRQLSLQPVAIGAVRGGNETD